MHSVISSPHTSSTAARRRSWIVLIAALAFWALPTRPALAQFSLSQTTVRVGEAVSIMLPAGADTLHVTYRPQSQIAIHEEFSAAGGEMITWTPDRAGLVMLSSSGGNSQYVSVRYARTPLGGVFMLIMAGVILIGGAAIGMYHQLRGEQAIGGP